MRRDRAPRRRPRRCGPPVREQIYFKYCSTFDSTDAGNIGPVIDELSARLHADFTIACPAYPALKRTVYAGHLFVGYPAPLGFVDAPSSPDADDRCESGAGARPADARTSGAGRTGDGRGRDPGATAARFAELAGTGHHGGHRRRAVRSAPRRRRRSERWTSAGHWRRCSGRGARAHELQLPRVRERTSGGWRVRAPVAMLSGSCSAATLAQIEQAAAVMPTREIDPLKIAENPAELPRLIEWACEQIESGGMLLYSSGEPGRVQAVQKAARPYSGGRSRRERIRRAGGCAGRARRSEPSSSPAARRPPPCCRRCASACSHSATSSILVCPGPRASSPRGLCSRSSRATSARETSSSRHWSAHDDGTAGARGAGRIRTLALSARIQLRDLGKPECASTRRCRLPDVADERLARAASPWTRSAGST